MEVGGGMGGKYYAAVYICKSVLEMRFTVCS